MLADFGNVQKKVSEDLKGMSLQDKRKAKLTEKATGQGSICVNKEWHVLPTSKLMFESKIDFEDLKHATKKDRGKL